MKQRSGLVWVALFVVAVAVGFVARPGRTGGSEMDPRSTSPTGARALSELVERFGANVETDGFDDSTDTVVVLANPSDSTFDEEIEEWVRNGGHLVWLDSATPFVPLFPDTEAIAESEGAQVARGECSIPELADLSALVAPSIGMFAVGSASGVCFANGPAGAADATAAVAQFPLGDGVVSVADGTALHSNENLPNGDNAALIVRLATSDNADRVSLIHRVTMVPLGPGVDGEVGIFDLTPARVNVFIFQLVVVAGLWLWYRGRRFGKVVTETQLVEIPASLLVRSTAELQRRAGGDEWAAATLRSDFVDRLRREHRLPLNLDIEIAAQAVAQRTGCSHDVLRTVLSNEAAGQLSLADLVAAIDEVSLSVFPQPTVLDRVAGAATEPSITPDASQPSPPVGSPTS